MITKYLPLVRFLAISLVVYVLGFPQPRAALLTISAQGAYWPTQGWRSSTPEAQGMSKQSLAQMLDAVNQQHLNLHSLLIIRHGYIVSETYFAPYEQGTKHALYSCTKSFISTLIGIALDQNSIKSVEQPVAAFLPMGTFDNVDAAKKQMTIENLLTMTSGLDWKENDSTFTQMYRSRDWVKYVMDEPMKTQPGTQFNYCSGCSHVLSAILQNATGTKTLDFATKNLFQPLGISGISWETDSSGIALGGWGLQMTPRDMAKVGYLYLHDGYWDGKQIIASSWIDTATRKHTATDNDLYYGYQWWISPSLEGYAALGRYGQTIFVIPKLDLVVVTTASLENHDPIFRLIAQFIVPAVGIQL